MTQDPNYNKSYILDGTKVSGSVVVFNLTSSQLANAQELHLNFNSLQTILINVSGAAADTWNGNIFFNGSQVTGDMAAVHSQLLFNFVGATSLNLNASIEGSILAPDANVTSAGYLHIGGSLIANSLSGTNTAGSGGYLDSAHIELHSTPFLGANFLPFNATPEPGATATLAAIVMVGGGVLTRRRRKPRAA